MGAGRPGIVLIGLRRAGKSVVGRRLAEDLALGFEDLDEVVARHAGRPVADLLAQDGEAAFRRLEHEAVLEVTSGAPCVLACGGGTPLREDNRERLAAFGRVLYLRVGEAELVRRLDADADPASRPLIAGREAREEVGLLLAERDPVYVGWADAVVDGVGSVGEVVRRCRAALGVV